MNNSNLFITSLVQTPGDRQNAFTLSGIRLLTNIIYIEKALKGTEIVLVLINRNFVLTVFVLTRFYFSSEVMEFLVTVV